jgi:hypothetical protein
MRVPKDLLSLVNSKEIHRSLGTTDRRAAKALALTLKVKLESEFVQLRQQAILNSRVIQDYSGSKQPVCCRPEVVDDEHADRRGQAGHTPEPVYFPAQLVPGQILTLADFI